MMIRLQPSLALLALLANVVLPVAHAQDASSSAVTDKNDPRQVLAYQGEAVLTQQAIDAAFSRIPEQNRLMFIRDGAKVDQLLRSLLQAQIVAADARSAGFANDPLVRERMRQAAEKELAEAWVVEIARRAPPADYEALAYEDYLANPEEYSTGVLLDVSLILIGTDERTAAEAEALAVRLKAELAEDPSRFDAMVREYSDDPAKLSNGGKYQRIAQGQMVKPFEKAAYALETPGQISNPVETEYGYHLIRLDARYEPAVPRYEKIKDEVIARAKQKYVESYRSRYLQKLLMEPIVFPEGSVEIMARRHFGENLEKAPVFTEDPDD
jgi:peptidyl-prolyl cis-trans isomerase C